VLNRFQIPELTWLALVIATAGPIFVAPVCAEQDAAKVYEVRGVVLNSVTHQPIARALVDGQQDAILTDNDGRFELHLAEGGTQIVVRRPGYSQRQGLGHFVAVGANMPEFTFYLVPQASITGRVTLSTGEAADEVRFTAYRKWNINGHARWMMQGMFTTNSEGIFHMTDLEAPDSYMICSTSSQEGSGNGAPGTIRYGYPPVCYPGTTDLSSASALTVTPGQQAEADFTITRQPFYPVSITAAKSEKGQPMGIQIHDQSGRGMGYPAQWREQRGSYEAYLPNGRYYAEAQSRGESPAYGRIDFSVADAPLTGLNLVTLPLHPTPVQIHKEFSEDSSGGGPRNFAGAVQIGSGSQQGEPQPGLMLTLSSDDATMGNMGGAGLRHVRGSLDPDAFELPEQTPGRYWLRTYAFQGYVSSITSGGVDLAREPLVIGSGGTSAPIEITLRNDGGRITGTVGSGTPPGSTVGELSAFISAIPLFPTTTQMPVSAVYGGNGQFTMMNVPPGSYRIVASDKAPDFDTADPQEMARVSAHGQTVTVEAGGTVNVLLDAVQPGAGELNQ
jgi:hypothetical protein